MSSNDFIMVVIAKELAATHTFRKEFVAVFTVKNMNTSVVRTHKG